MLLELRGKRLSKGNTMKLLGVIIGCIFIAWIFIYFGYASKIENSGFTVHYLIGTELLLSNRTSFYFQYKHRIGKCESKFIEEPSEFSNGSIETEDMSLSGIEIILGVKYLF